MKMKRSALLAATGLGGALTAFKSNSSTDKKNCQNLPKTAIVIGGGVIGVSTAFQLAKRGIKVTLVEQQNGVAEVASFCNGAIICHSMAASWASASLLAENPGELKKVVVSSEALLSPAFWRWSAWFWLNSLMPGWSEYNHQSQRQLSLFSQQCMKKELEQYSDKLGSAINKSCNDTIKLFHNQKEMDCFIQSNQASFWAEAGYEFKSLNKFELLSLEPSLADDPDLVGGVLCNVDSSGDIHIYTKMLSSMTKDEGVKYLFGRKVTNLKVKDKKVVEVKLDDGQNLMADIVVLAAGAASANIARTVGVNLPIYPLKGHLATVKCEGSGSYLTRNIYSPRHGLASPITPGLVRLSGGVEAVGWNNQAESKKSIKLVEGMKPAFKPGMLDGEVSVYSGLRPVIGDDVATIGQTGQVDNLFVNTGHGSKGWTLSWGSSVLLAQIVCGEIPEIEPSRFSPKRFHPIINYFEMFG